MVRNMITNLHKFRLLPMILGVAFCLIGWFFVFIKAGLPYQDPTPEMTSHYNWYSTTGSALMQFGLFLIVAGLLISIIYKIKNQKKQ